MKRGENMIVRNLLSVIPIDSIILLETKEKKCIV